MDKRRNTLIIIVGSMVLLMLIFFPSWRAPGGTTASTTLPTSTTVLSTVATTPANAAPTRPAATPSRVPPTATPTPFTFPPASSLAGVDVGGLTIEVAKARLTASLRRDDRTIVLATEGYSTTLPAAEFVKLPPVDQLVARGRANVYGTAPVKLPLQLSIDRPALQAFVERIAPGVDRPAATAVVSDAQALTQTFTFKSRPARRLNVNQTIGRITQELRQPTGARQLELVVESPPGARPPMAELERVLRAHAALWKGVAGLYVRDLQTGETVAYNADTVFSGASVMKVPIMIFAYSRLGALDDEQRGWMQRMIIESQNLDANSLLAAAVDGEGTEAALQGVNEMTAMLKRLGLSRTYMLIPYESGDWLIQQSMLPGGGPAREGAEPFTAADGYVRTTPREMGELFVMLDECAQGTGPLLKKVGGKLNDRLCQEMLGWLQQPHDQERMVAGLPSNAKVAHKGGWVEDMQSDVGIVESPGGRYVAAIYIWRDGYVTDANANPSPYLGDFSHTIYTFFNPEPLDK